MRENSGSDQTEAPANIGAAPDTTPALAIPQWGAWRRPQALKVLERSRRRTLVSLAVAAILLGALVALLLVRVVAASRGLATTPVSPLIGHPAPDFTIQTWTWNGAPSQSVHLAALRGRPVVINFWASWCDACRAEEPALEAAYQRYQTRGAVFIGVAFDDTEQNGVPFLRQYQVTFPSGPDVTGAISINYGLTGVPETVFIDRSGIVRQKWIGGITDGARNINTMINSLLSPTASASTPPMYSQVCSGGGQRCVAPARYVLYASVRDAAYGGTRTSKSARDTATNVLGRALT